MKISEIKTEEDINQYIGEREVNKMITASRQTRRQAINNILPLGAIFIVVLLGTLYPPIQESIAKTVANIVQDLANWYVILVLVFIAIVRRIIRYRIG